MRWILCVLTLWILAGTALAGETRRVLAIGDSVMAWHAWTGRDIPSVIENALRIKVDSEAMPGARFSNRSGVGQSLRYDVRSQFDGGTWDLVLMNGGANDLLGECGCSACERVLDSLIGANLKGEIPDFVDRVRATGARVLWMGYYASYRSGQFKGCRPYIVEMEKRIARLATRHAGLRFIDSEDVIDKTKRNLFALDGIHPSAKGARLIGRYLAQAIDYGRRGGPKL